jgi:AraC-like DNA-binding protein
MDVHNVPGVKARNVAEAHRQDLLHQQEYGCNCMTYWIDEGRESVFCLIEAPSKEAVIDMHNQAHGLIPHKIIEVSSSVVEAFLGRIYDPEGAEVTDDGFTVFNDPSFRVLVVTKTTDPILLLYQLGSENATELLNKHNLVIRRNVQRHQGREVEYGGSGFILSFATAATAVACAMDIQKEFTEADVKTLGFKMSINSGEPIEKSNHLFGDTIQLAEQICTIARYFTVALTSSVKELVSKDHFERKDSSFFTLAPQDEALLRSLYNQLEANWQDPYFDLENYRQTMAMSKSQLYRKCIMLTGLPPNMLLKEFRLEKARELMKKHCHNITQVTFDSGFTSPSYFTKCFKKKFGLLPKSYMELVP